MKKEPKFVWDDNTGTATCYLDDGKNTYIGTAICAEADNDMKSAKTGCTIALYRAEIKYYLHLRDNEIKPALAALRHAYSCINHSPTKSKVDSYESKSLRREIYRKENDLSIISIMLKDKKDRLRNLIDEKDKFYQQIRKMRNKAKNN